MRPEGAQGSRSEAKKYLMPTHAHLICMRFMLTAAAGCGLAAAIFAQDFPSFEVASIKRAKLEAGICIGLFTYPGGRIECRLCTLDTLVYQAFNLPFRISGESGWMTQAGDRYNIEAKPPASSNAAQANPPFPTYPLNEEQRLMLQSLLAERFHLRVHREVKQERVYVLLRGDGELKLWERKDKEAKWVIRGYSGAIQRGDGIFGRNCKMAALAKALVDWLGYPVEDRTGLKGSYDFEYEIPPDARDPDLAASIIRCFRAIGLKLEPGRGPVSTLVIDHAEKPSPN